MYLLTSGRILQVWDDLVRVWGRILSVFGTDPVKNLGRILLEFGTNPGSVWDGSCQSFGTDAANIKPARDTPQYRILAVHVYNWDKSCVYNTLFFHSKLLQWLLHSFVVLAALT